MLDIDKPLLDSMESSNLEQCVKDGSLAQGRYVNLFEKDFSEFCDVKYSCAVMNGTCALHLALATLDVKPGDEVLVPSLTFMASVSPILYCNAIPVFVDSDPKTWCMDVGDLKKKITPKSKAVIPVHLYGNSCEMDLIRNIADTHDLRIVEDCAEAHGTRYDGKQVGSFSDIAFFSFYRNKIFTTGEGGMCVTNSGYLNDRMRMLRSHGKRKAEDLNDSEFVHEQFVSQMLGFNYRMTDLQAAVGVAQIKKAREFIAKRMYYADIYKKELVELDVVMPCHNESVVRNTYWGFPILLKDSSVKEIVMMGFRKNGIRLRSFFNPCHLQPFIKSSDSCPIAVNVSSRGIVLPNIQTLSEDDVYGVIRLLKQFM